MAFRLSREADADLLNIYLTGADQFGVAQAEIYAAGLATTFAFLADHPRAARERNEIDPPVRVHRYKAHLILYIIEDEDVMIVRIRHGHEDWIARP